MEQVARKEYDREYYKKYYEEHKEVRKAYNKKYYAKHKEYYKDYNRKVMEGRKRNCIYRIMNKDGKILIIGSTTNIYVRCANYHSNNTSIKLKSNYKKYGYSHFEVAYLSKNINRTELYWIEDYLIRTNKTLLNQVGAYNEDNRIHINERDKKKYEIISDSRKKELEDIAKRLIFNKYE